MSNSLDIIIPIFNENDCLDKLKNELIKLTSKFSESISFILINDGSSDGSREALDIIAKEEPAFKVIHLSRNFGHQYALTAGLDHSEADYIAIIDADLQDPPILIVDM